MKSPTGRLVLAALVAVATVSLISSHPSGQAAGPLRAEEALHREAHVHHAVLDLIGVHLDLAAVEQHTIDPREIGLPLRGPRGSYEQSAECREGGDVKSSAAARAQAVASGSARLRPRGRGLVRDRVAQNA